MCFTRNFFQNFHELLPVKTWEDAESGRSNYDSLTSSNRSFKKKFLLHDLRICLQSDSYCVNLRNNRAWEKWVVDTPLSHHATDVTAPSDMSALIINLFQFDWFRSKTRHDVHFVIASILLRLSWSFSSNERLLMSRRSDSFDGSVPSSLRSSRTCM